MSEIVISIDAAKTSGLLARLERGVKNQSGTMKDIGTYLTGFFSGQVFASRGGVIGEPWRPLNPNYAVYKARQYPGRPPLVRTGLMQRSFKAQTGPLSVRLYNTAKYFDAHQGGHGVPQRVMMKVDNQRAEQIGSIVVENLMRGIA